MDRADIQTKLLAQTYAVTEKTDGVRALLFCTTYRDLKVCLLIDRAMKLFVAPLRCVPAAWY